MAGKVTINKGEISRICTCLISSVCFVFLFLPDDNKYCFKARDRLHCFRPASDDIEVAHYAVQRDVFHLTRYLLRAALTAEERSSPPTASGGSGRHRHPLRELSSLPTHLPRPGCAWAALASAGMVVHLAWTQLAAGKGDLLGIGSGGGFGRKGACECRERG